LNVIAYRTDSSSIARIVKYDSVAGATTFDTLFVRSTGLIPPNSKIAVKLDNGFSYGATTVNTGIVGLKTRYVNAVSPSYSVTSPITNDSLIITLGSSDTLWALNSPNGRDSLVLVLGNSSISTNRIITNVTADSITGWGRVRKFNSPFGSKAYKVYVYDADGRLIQTNVPKSAAVSYDDSTGAQVVSNIFTGGPIAESYHYSVGTEVATFDTAGGTVDTLIIPFQLGASLDNGDWLEIHFSGLSKDAAAAAVAGNYFFGGDTAGTTDQDFNLTVGDTSIRIGFNAGDLLGSGATGTPYMCYVRITDVFRNLGSSTGLKSPPDDIDIGIITSAQSDMVRDTTYFMFTVPDYTPDLTGGTLGAGTPEAGSLTDLIHGYDYGTEHGYLPANGIVDIYFPDRNDSSSSVYEYTFPVSDPGASSGDSSGGSSYKYASNSNFMVRMGTTDTLGISWIVYDTLAGQDSSRFRIKLDGTQSNVESDSTLVLFIDDQIYAPREATAAGGAGTADGSYGSTLASAAQYGFRIELRDRRGYLISRGKYLTGFDIQPGSANRVLVLIEGEKHDPGSTAGVRSIPDSQTVGISVPSAYLLVDQYSNIVSTSPYKNHNVSVALTTGTYGVIDDNNGGTAGHFTLGGGGDYDDAEFYYPNAADNDSLTILTARDTNTSLGRGTPTYLQADLLSVSLSGEPTNSNSFVVGSQAYNSIMPFTFVTETYVPGDTANEGKSDAGNDELSTGTTYSMTAYAVDRYYNRIDSSGLGQCGNLDASLTVGTGVTIGTVPEQWDSDGSITFTIKPSTTGNKTITVTQGAYSGSISLTAVSPLIKVIFLTAPVLTNNAGESILVTVDTFQFNGTFGSGEGFKLWAYTSKGETHMSTDAGGTLLVSGIQEGENGTPSSDYTTTIDSRSGYQKGIRYYIYATISALGDSVVGSDTVGVVMKRYPLVKTSVRPVTPSTDHDTLNSGGNSPQNSFDMQYKVVDYDDGTVDVRLYLSKKSNLDTNHVDGNGWLSEVADTTVLIKTLTNYDSSFTFNITDTLTESTVHANNPYMLKGSYYVYINTVDDDVQADVERSDYKLSIKHAPSLGVDRPVSGRTRIDTKDTKYLTINWSTTGVYDLDDEAELAVYYDTTTANHGTDVSSLLASTKKKQLTSGFTLSETQNWPDSLQYNWNLSSATSSLIPKSGGAYDFYVLARDDEDTVMAQSPGDVLFYHSPSFNFHFNLGGVLGKGKSAAVRQVIINKGETFRFTWDGSDLDENQYVRLAVTQLDGYDYEELTFPDEATDDTPADAWIVNSTDGTQPNAETVRITAGSYNWFSGTMTGLDSVDGDYYVIAFVTNNGSSATWNNETTDRFQAEGTFQLVGTESTSATDNHVTVVPGIITTNTDDTVRLYVYLDSKGETVDEVRFNLKVDSTKFEVLDQDDGTVGVQPYKYYSDYFFGGAGISLVQNERDHTTAAGLGDNYYRLRFAKVDPAVEGGDVANDEIVASFLLKSKGTDSTTTIYSRVLFEHDDVVLSNNGISQDISVPTPAVKVYTNPLGRIRGRIPLQGREVYDKVVTVEIRPYGSLIPIDNGEAEYVSANDVESGASGVQVQTDRDGFYELTKIPTGTYDITVKVPGWLSGQYRNISIVPGDFETSINPTYDNSAVPVDRGELLAGDVSSGDAPGYTDNVVDEDDITFITSYYDSVATGLLEKADINRSGYIDFTDLSWTSLNTGKEGVPPVYNKNAGADNAMAYFKLEGIPEQAFINQEFDVKVWAKNVSDLRGYTFTLCYDPDKLEIVNDYGAIEEGNFLISGNSSNRSVFFTVYDKKGLEFVSVLLGYTAPATGEGIVASVRMRSLIQDERPDISLVDIIVANRVNRFNRLKDVRQVPSDFELSQNYPNPFNPETKIKFQLPIASKVILKVYNMLGQEVRTLVDSDMRAGYHSVVWDGRNDMGIQVASGVYIYRIKAAKYVTSRKMVLLK